MFAQVITTTEKKQEDTVQDKVQEEEKATEQKDMLEESPADDINSGKTGCYGEIHDCKCHSDD